jgi:hypothetical protein
MSGSARRTGYRRTLLAGAGVLLVVAAGLTVVCLSARGGNPGAESRRRAAIDSLTGEVFTGFAIRDGDSQPWKHPRTGRRTVYRAEACYWTRSGGVRTRPTYVLLNALVGKDGPTICPDCGRIVVAHNPTPPLEMMAAAFKSVETGR